MDNTLGRVETQSSTWAIQQLWPSKFDMAENNMEQRVWINAPDFITGMKAVGTLTNPVRKFLIAYIEVATTKKKTVNNLNITEFWNEIMMKGMVEDSAILNLYLNTLIQLNAEGQIPKEIFQPFSYIPEHETVIQAAVRKAAKKTGEVLEDTGKWVKTLSVIALVLGAGIVFVRVGGVKRRKR